MTEERTRAQREMDEMVRARAKGEPSWTAMLISIPIFALLVILINLASVGFSGLWRLIGLYPARATVAVIAIFLGVVAHKFKQSNQFWYGMVEWLFGAAGAINLVVRLGKEQTIISQWASLGACAYVMARGLNNISEAKAKMVRVTALPAPSTNP